jgi:hypothetical protein
MRGSIVRVAGIVAVLGAGMVIGRSVLAENGSVAAVTVRSAGAQEYIKVVGSTDDWFAPAAETWQPVTSAAIVIPAGHNDLITVDFFAESYCYDPAAPEYCRLRARAGATELLPAAGIDFIFDVAQEANGTVYSYESQAMSRFVCLNGGANGATYRIYIEGWKDAEAMSFKLDDWTLRITRSHSCATS